MLTAQTILGAGWTVSSRLASRLIDFATLLVLARMLTPADFGLTALAMTLIVIVDTVLDMPLIQFLTSLKSAEKSHLDTAFTLGVLRGGVLSCVVLMAAWPFSLLYHDHRLVSLVSVIAIGPIARSLYSPAMVKYFHQMSFRQVFIAELMGKAIASFAAVSVLFLGGGYWAIAATSVTAPLASTVISYLLAPYRPAFSLCRFSEFSTFLLWLSPAQIISAVSWQFDRLFLGHFIPKAALGQYTMASDLSVFPTQSLIGPAMQPVMAAFSRINDDRERLRNAFLKTSRATMLLVAPTCVGMSLTSDMIIRVLLGPKWADASVYFRWLALATLLSAFYQSLYSLSLATNRTNVIFRLNLIDLCSRMVLVPIGFYLGSIMGVVAARGATSVIVFVLSVISAGYLTDLDAASEIGNLRKVVGACCVMTALVLMLRYELAEEQLHVAIKLAITAAVGAIAYFGALVGFGVRYKDYFEIA